MAGTLDESSPKDDLAHIAGAKESMRLALVAARERRAPDPSHDRGALFHANPERCFATVEADARRAVDELAAEVARLAATALASSPE